MRRNLLVVMYIVFAVLMSGCAKKTMVVLMPDQDGNVGHVTVQNDAGSVDVTKPGEATYISDKNAPPTPPQKISEEKIEKEFGEALSILPQPPEHYILYFKIESTKLTPASISLLPQVIESVERRNSQAISVVGHTDTAGDRQYNLRLSKKRAEAVARMLVQKGVNKAYIESTSHGEENPLVKTADNVIEPKNRRVEVIVR